jgi:hypothetical protein
LFYNLLENKLFCVIQKAWQTGASGHWVASSVETLGDFAQINSEYVILDLV